MVQIAGHVTSMGGRCMPQQLVQEEGIGPWEEGRSMSHSGLCTDVNFIQRSPTASTRFHWGMAVIGTQVSIRNAFPKDPVIWHRQRAYLGRKGLISASLSSRVRPAMAASSAASAAATSSSYSSYTWNH